MAVVAHTMRQHLARDTGPRRGTCESPPAAARRRAPSADPSSARTAPYPPPCRSSPCAPSAESAAYRPASAIRPVSRIVTMFASGTVGSRRRLSAFRSKIRKKISAPSASFAFCRAGLAMTVLPISDSSINSTRRGFSGPLGVPSRRTTACTKTQRDADPVIDRPHRPKLHSMTSLPPKSSGRTSNTKATGTAIPPAFRRATHSVADNDHHGSSTIRIIVCRKPLESPPNGQRVTRVCT